MISYIIYLVAFLEGFTTLSVEIVAIRQFTPIVGTNSISTSIILGVILLALSYWYYRWWVIADRWIKIEKKLLINLCLSSFYYTFISFTFYSLFLQGALELLNNYFLAVLFSSFFLFAIPVFFASQTIPLLAKLLWDTSQNQNIWKLLFYSTVWSFAGSVGTSTLLFPLLGVTKTSFISPILLLICAIFVVYFFMRSKKYTIILGWIITIFLFFLFTASYTTPGTLYKWANAYQNIHIFESDTLSKRFFFLNNAYSSGIDITSGESFFSYIQETKRQLEILKPKKVLVIGAAGFTFPQEISKYDFVQTIDVVDIDKSLKEIAETYFLQEKLSEKITFFPEPSRYFLNHIDTEYDFVFVDVYTWKSLPPQILTLEFFEKVEHIWESIYFNFILDAPLESHFSQSIFSTLGKIFPEVYYKNVSGSNEGIVNFIVTNIESQEYIFSNITNGDIYTDDLHSIEQDRFLLEYHSYKK